MLVLGMCSTSYINWMILTRKSLIHNMKRLYIRAYKITNHTDASTSFNSWKFITNYELRRIKWNNTERHLPDQLLRPTWTFGIKLTVPFPKVCWANPQLATVSKESNMSVVLRSCHFSDRTDRLCEVRHLL